MTRIALIGVGKIARDRHLPAILSDHDFELVATADPIGVVDGIAGFRSVEALIDSRIPVDAAAICTPPSVRHAIAAKAIDAGLHVLLEKPPAATGSQFADLAGRAAKRGVTIFAAWHSRAAAGVAATTDWLAHRRIEAVRVVWREDVRRWHPGQEWILEHGGYGVFDPGINALSILTAILPQPLMLTAATLETPVGRGAPIAAHLSLATGAAFVDAVFDFRETGDQIWSIDVDTDWGTLRLLSGGADLVLPGEPPRRGDDAEYQRLYQRFSALIASGRSDADAAPLHLVADAFLVGRHEIAPEFDLSAS